MLEAVGIYDFFSFGGRRKTTNPLYTLTPFLPQQYVSRGAIVTYSLGSNLYSEKHNSKVG